MCESEQRSEDTDANADEDEDGADDVVHNNDLP